MRVQENRGDLHLAALYLNFLQPTELEDAVQLLPLVHRGEQRLHLVQAALFQDGHIVHLLGQENKRKHKEISASAWAWSRNCPSNMLLLCTQQCPGLACALGTLAGGNAAYPNGSTTECKQQKYRDFTHLPCAHQREDLAKHPLSASTGKTVV